MINKQLIKTSIINVIKRRARSLLTILSVLIGVTSIFVLISFGQGLVGYVDDLSQNTSQLKAPVPPDQVLDATPLFLADSQGYSAEEFGEEDSDSEPIILDTALDYTNLSNWFGSDDAPQFAQDAEEGQVISYMIDIPKVDVKNAIVAVGGTDLNHGLIQYPGTANPGQAGSPVIFGHSILRQFYNPDESNSRRYKSIFSYIMTLERGDKIFVTVEGVKYTYVVQSKTEVKPTDTYILSQRYDARQLKLVTCTPEGTYLRRGVVTAQLVKNK